LEAIPVPSIFLTKERGEGQGQIFTGQTSENGRSSMRLFAGLPAVSFVDVIHNPDLSSCRSHTRARIRAYSLDDHFAQSLQPPHTREKMALVARQWFKSDMANAAGRRRAASTFESRSARL